MESGNWLHLDERVVQTLNLLSNSIAAPVSNFIIKSNFDDKVVDNKVRLDCSLDIGDYSINLWHELTKDEDEFDSDELDPTNCGFDLKFKGDSISRSCYGVIESFSIKKLNEDISIVKSIWDDFLLKNFGGFDARDPVFMDYEMHSVDGLTNGNESYFNSIYLFTMCHLKERGVVLPPILSKNPSVAEHMDKGDVESLQELLTYELGVVESNLGERAYKHALAESEQIIKRAWKRKMYFNRSVPLAEKFSNVMNHDVPGETTGRKYNLLVVEETPSFSGIFDDLSKKVAVELAKSGKYSGTNVFSSFNLPECIKLCCTGQIDLLIMDGSRNVNPFDPFVYQAQEINGDSDNSILGMSSTLDLSEGMPSHLPKPSDLGIVIKHKWQKMIYDEMRKYELDKFPPCYIIREDVMGMDLIPFFEENLTGKHPYQEIIDRIHSRLDSRETLAYQLEAKIRNICDKRNSGVELIVQSIETLESKKQAMFMDEYLKFVDSLARLPDNPTAQELYSIVCPILHSFSFGSDPEKIKINKTANILNQIDILLERFPQHKDNLNIKEDIISNLGCMISVGTTQLEDVGYWVELKQYNSLARLVGNIHMAVYSLVNDPLVKSDPDSIMINEPLSSDKYSVSEAIEENFLRPVFYVVQKNLSRFVEEDNQFIIKPEGEILLSMAKSIAELTGNLLVYQSLYAQKFVVTRLPDE